MKTFIQCADLGKRQEEKLKRNKINGTLLGITDKIKTEDFKCIYECNTLCTDCEIICIVQFLLDKNN
jgi:hypothetical protein